MNNDPPSGKSRVKPFLIALILIAGCFAGASSAQEAHPSDLTANDLAEALSIHWWSVKLPNDLKPKDQICVELITSNGQYLPGGTGVADASNKVEGTIRVFCWENQASHLGMVSIKTPTGFFSQGSFEDYFAEGAVGGPSNGAVLNPGDIMLKFVKPDSSKNTSFTGGNSLDAGQIGLRITIIRAHS